MVKIEGSPDVIEPQDLESNPLEDMGYEPESRADRSREIEEFDRNQRLVNKNQPEKRGWLRSSLDRLNKGKQKTKGLSGDKISGKKDDPGLSESLGDRAKERSKEEVKKRARRIAREQIKKAVVQFISKNPYVWAAVGIILLIIIIFAIIFALFGLGGKGGNGPAIYPNSTQEKNEAVLLAGLTGDASASGEALLKQVNELKTKLQNISKEAKKTYDQAKATKAESEINSIIKKVDELIVLIKDLEERGKRLTEINSLIESFSKSYPELLYPSGECSDIKKYIDNKKFRITRPQEMKTIANGQLIRGGHKSLSSSETGLIPANANLCRTIVYILDKGFSIDASTLTYGHSKGTKSGNISQHFVGEAIDIAMLNGNSVKSSMWKEETKELMTLLQSNSKTLGIYELWGPHGISIDNCKATTRTISGHNDHIHIGFTNKSNVKRCSN